MKMSSKHQQKPFEIRISLPEMLKRLQHRCFLVNSARFPRTRISEHICERLLVKDVNFSEFYYFFVVVFKDFGTAIFKTSPNGSVLI